MPAKLIIILVVVSAVTACQFKADNKNYRQAFKQWAVDSTYTADENKNTIFLFLSEGMCAGCVDHELKNVSAVDTLIKDRIVILGAFDHKRKFYAMMENLKGVKLLFVNYTSYTNYPLMFHMEKSLPVYFALDKDYNLIKEFRPDPNNEQSTLKFIKDQIK